MAGIVKRRGTKIKKRKHFRTAKKRLIGSQGCFNPGITSWRVPMAGQLGNANRLCYNLKLLPSKYLPDEENKNNLLHSEREYILVRGSVPGPNKSIALLRKRLEIAENMIYHHRSLTPQGLLVASVDLPGFVASKKSRGM